MFSIFIRSIELALSVGVGVENCIFMFLGRHFWFTFSENFATQG